MFKKLAKSGTDTLTDRHTDGHCNLETESAQSADSVKISKNPNFCSDCSV